MSAATHETAQPLPADQFRAGEVWQSPRGTEYRVTFVAGGMATLVAVAATNCSVLNRKYDAIIGWARIKKVAP